MIKVSLSILISYNLWWGDKAKKQTKKSTDKDGSFKVITEDHTPK